MGKKGSIIKNISDISGAKIDVDKEKGILNIRGSKDAVSFAKEEFLDIINGIEVFPFFFFFFFPFNLFLFSYFL